MKRYIANIFLGLGLCQAALGGPSPIYQNFGVVTQPPVVDAVAFVNQGQFLVDTLVGINRTNIETTLYEDGFNPLPFMTKDTLYITNSSSGFMQGIPGFRFDTATSTSRHSAGYFLNEGIIQGLDEEADIFDALYSVVGSTVFVVVSALGQPTASQMLVHSTNIVNSGTMSVGNNGLLQLSGNNVTNAFGTLTAGYVSSVGSTNFEQDSPGLEGQDQSLLMLDGPYYFLSSPGVYDLFWGVTNGLNVDVSGLANNLPEDIPNFISGERGLVFPPEIPLNFDTAKYLVSAELYTVNGTNTYYNLVFVNTNFADTNLSATIGFSGVEDLEYASITLPFDPFGREAIVQFAEPVYDVITGQTVTNGVYLIDDGAYLPVMTLAVDASAAGGDNTAGLGYSRPNAFELTTVTPPEWNDSIAGNTGYIPDDIYTTNEFTANIEPMDVSEYGAQVGHNPASLSGSFSTLSDTNSIASLFLDDLAVNLPDPTNDPARIEINAGNFDNTQARMRAEGMVILNVTNLTGASAAGMDWGEANANIGATNGVLTLSNIFPTTFQRVRGNIYAVSVTWQNSQTNNNFGNTNNAVTNQWHYHVLVVDQNLFGSFPSTVRTLNVTGKDTIVLQDNMNVISKATFNTTNLIVNSSNYFSQFAENFTPANTPYLQNLLVTTNGLLSAVNYLDIGFNANQGQGAPTGRKYTLHTITNFGQMIATAPLLQSAIFENDGQIRSDNRGSIIIEANTLGLGLALTNATNTLLADANVDLSAASIEASNSIISAGLDGAGSLTLDATKELTDFVSGIPTTNTNSVIINHWTVTGGGFSLPVKPATGDLFGTEIHTIATNFEEVIHVWAGTDKGATPAGFVNNAVIGRLVLDRQSSNSVLRFSAAGAANAMYVDYLELTNFAFSQYRSGLLIDPNLTIYFAACNADPEKLMEVYPGLKWVQNFAGPNSTVIVPYLNSSNVCLMNTNLAFSFEISFFNSLPNIDNQPYVLNDPSNPTNVYPCPGDETTLRSFLVSTLAPGGSNSLNLLNISVNGEGSITPKLAASQLALGKSYTLTATPAKGWVFENWSTIGLAGAVNANSRILPFNFVTNTLITANFIPIPFGAVQGVYNGLFSEAGAANPGNSGVFTLTLEPNGSFSGRLRMGPGTYSFSSQLSTSGGAQVQAKSGAKSLTLNFQLDMTGQTGRILGDVNGGSWDAPLAADIAPVWSARNPPPLAGKYTMVMPWESPGGLAGGDSYGTGSVNKLGVLTIAGALADGATFSASAPVSRDGLWPFYVYAPAGRDSVLGWVSVGNGLSGTNVTWSKVAGKGALYAAGFTNVLSVVGSPWQAPAKNFVALTLTDPVVTLNGGGLLEPLSVGVALQKYLNFTATNVSLSINAASGGLSGWFDSPGTGRRETVSGVVLQNTASARGFFQGANESGAVLLQGATGPPDGN